MQIAYRMCAACDVEITRIGDGDGCGACDIVLCRRCLQGTMRCPGCQRPLLETRDAPAVLGRRDDPTVALGRSLVLGSVAGLILTWIWSLAANGRPNIVILFAQSFVAFALTMQLLRGRLIARWTIVLVAAALGLYLGFHAGGEVMSLVRAIVLGGAALVLAIPRPVSRYLQMQRVRHP